MASQPGWRLAESWQQSPVKDPPVGSKAWAPRALAEGPMRSSLIQSLAKARRLAGLAHYDQALARFGDPYTKFRVTGDVKHLEAALDSCIESPKYNFGLLTSEVLSTDRAAIPGADKHFAALVVDDSNTAARLAAYNFREEPRTIQARFWRWARSCGQPRCLKPKRKLLR